MIEQYLYSRSSNKKQNSKGDIIEEGFGGIAKTNGLSNEDIKTLEVFGNDYYPTVTCKDETKPSVYMKYSLDNKTKDMVLAKTASISQPQRMAHISHQIVFRDENKKQAIQNINTLFSLNFIDHDVDNEDIILDQMSEAPCASPSINMDLRDVLNFWTLTPDDFWKLITCVFDCVELNRKLIFLLDYTNENVWDNIRDLLYHIYRFLPTNFREIVGFDSCYSKNSNKPNIHICFADYSVSKKISKTLYKLDTKNCLYDYVVDKGEIIHTVEPEKNESFGSSNIFLKDIQLKICDELLRHQHNRDLDKSFFSIYDLMLDGASTKVLSSVNSYSAVSIVNQINSGRKVSREHAFLVIEKYLEINKTSFLIKDDIWISSIQNYFTLYEKDNSDNDIIQILVKMFSYSKNLCNFAFSLLKIKLQMDLKENGIEEIRRYSLCINKAKYAEKKQLVSGLFYNDKQISKWYIHYSFTECDSPKSVMDKTVWITEQIESPDTDFLVSVKKEIITRIQSFDLEPNDIQKSYSVVKDIKSIPIQVLYTELLEEIMRKVQYKSEPAQWFKTLPRPDKYSPRSINSVLPYLIGDILNKPDQTSISEYFDPYKNIITRKKQNDIILTSSEILTDMFLDGRIDLNKDHFDLLLLSVSSLGFIDITMLAMIICEYPEQIKDFLLWYSEIYNNYDLPDELIEIPDMIQPTKHKKSKKTEAIPNISKSTDQNTYYMDALLLSISQSLDKNLSTIDAKDISLCVELLMEQNLAGEYGKIFLPKLYSHFISGQVGVKKIFYKVKKCF